MTAHPLISDSPQMRVLVIQPDPQCPLDRLAPHFYDAGMRVRVVQPFKGEAIPEFVDEDALVILGGDMSSLDDATYSWLGDIRAIIVRASMRRVPTLGICLGAQLMAQAFGGLVSRGSHGLEAGVIRVTWQPAAVNDLLMEGLPNPLLVGSFHGDTIVKLPPGSEWLGSTDQYRHQAFRVGDRAWGVQFHPELSLDGFRRWLPLVDEGDVTGMQKARQGLMDFESYDATVDVHTQALLKRFIGLVGSEKVPRSLPFV